MIGKMIKNNGMFCAIKILFILIAFVLGGQKAVRLLHPGEKIDDKGLFESWYDIWEGTAKGQEINFVKFFQNIYFETYRKMEANKCKNFLFKSLYIGVLITAFVGYIMLFFFNLNQNGKTIYTLLENGFVLILFVLALTIILKWLDIKKYQETWVRHQQHIRFLQKEMLYYIYNMGDYSHTRYSTNDNFTFMTNIFEIENKNIIKFVDNMENKEEKLGKDFLDLMNILK